MNTLDIPHMGEQIEYASCMDELTPGQFAEYCRLFVELKSTKISIADFYVQMAVKLLDIHIPSGYHYYNPQKKEAIADNLRQVTETLEWLLVHTTEGDTVRVEPNLQFARNLVPVINSSHGPADALQNITLGEFRDALGHAQNYAQTLDENYLNLMCSTLYRPMAFTWYWRSLRQGWNGDRRYPYNAARSEAEAYRFSRYPFHLRYGAYLCFNAGLNFLRTGTVTIEGNEISFGVLWEGTSNSNQASPPGIGMAGVLFSLAETGVFGTLQQVERVNLYEGLARLYQVTINAPKPIKP